MKRTFMKTSILIALPLLPLILSVIPIIEIIP